MRASSMAVRGSSASRSRAATRDGSGRWPWPAAPGPFEMDAETHDRLVAAISHLPLITSVALVEAVTGMAGAPEPGLARRRRRSRRPAGATRRVSPAGT